LIVDRKNLADVVAKMACHGTWVVDTETTGIRPYHGDVPFSVGIYAGNQWYYLNFLEYEGEDIPVLTPDEIQNLFTLPKRVVFHNAKFDLSMLKNIGISFPEETELFCTMTLERVVCGNTPGKGDFSLDAMAAKYGYAKDDAVEKYVKDHKLWEDVDIPGKKRKFRKKFYQLVPPDIIIPYCGADVVATAGVYVKQMQRVKELQETAAPFQPDILPLVQQEMKLLKTVWKMEQKGVLIDRAFCKKAIAFYAAETKRLNAEFEDSTGKEFAPKPSLYKEIFEDEDWVYTAKGNPSFSSKVIDGFEGETAQIVKKLRVYKHLGDTYQGFLYHADEEGALHTNFNQHLARTGRFSSSAPNLQNMEKAEGEDLKEEFTPRRAIVPRPGHYFGMIDYRQMEYRMMLDYAGATRLIQDVNDGMDVHQAMADVIGYPRKKVKNGNFAILYGAGDARLAETIGGTLQEAQDLRRAIYSASPEIARFVEDVQNKTAQRKGRYIWNWMGRLFWFQDLSKSYKAPNALIQGGCADVVKQAMVKVDEEFPGTMVLSIHDEIVLEIPNGTDIIKSVCRIMRDVYKPRNGMILDVDAEWSDVSLADKKEWV
jgi:DNA polymerase I-like protein with 3'-5' exonuclease and polymerase domains